MTNRDKGTVSVFGYAGRDKRPSIRPTENLRKDFAQRTVGV